MQVWLYGYGTSSPVTALESGNPVGVPEWGLMIDRIYADTDPQRPELHRMLLAAGDRPPAYIALHDLWDLADDLSQIQENLENWMDLGIGLLLLPVSSQAPLPQLLLPSGSPEGQIFEGGCGNDWRRSPGVALMDWALGARDQQRRQRIRQGHAKNRLQGLPPPGKAPYGYRRGRDHYVIDRSVAPVMKAFFEHFLLYGSLRGAVRHLGLTYGKRISVSTGRRWLTHPVYRGDLGGPGGPILPNTHPPLLSRMEAAQVDRLLSRNRRLSTRSASAPRSLAGLVTCGTCQSPLLVSRVSTRDKRQDYLYLRPKVCPRQPGCGGLPYHQVLDKTIATICAQLPQAVAMLPAAGNPSPKLSLQEQIAAKDQILQQLPALLATGILDEATVQQRTYTLKTEMAELNRQLAELPPVNLQETVKTVSIPQFWTDLSETERRFYFREFLQRIEVVRDGESWSLHLVFLF
jgi:hypothetical protein